MIFVLYLVIAAVVTLLSIKAADYVDILDKKTSLSGAFIGGILLSAVTSLPELFTSISSTMLLEEPGLCIGNILGSNLFNLLILSVLMLTTFRSFRKEKVANGHIYVLAAVFCAYIAILCNMTGILNIDFFTINITTIIIVICYVVSFKYLSGEDGAANEDEDVSSLSLKHIIIRFILVSIGIIVLSIMISYVTDQISERLNLGKGIAGALFMGIATSLPELSSSITLFKKKNYDIAVGNIIGSNIFNFAILAITDVLYLKKGIYDFSDPKTINLLISGIIATPLLLVAIKIKCNWLRIVALIGIILSYIGFLVL